MKYKKTKQTWVTFTVRYCFQACPGFSLDEQRELSALPFEIWVSNQDECSCRTCPKPQEGAAHLDPTVSADLHTLSRSVQVSIRRRLSHRARSGFLRSLHF